MGVAAGTPQGANRLATATKLCTLKGWVGEGCVLRREKVQRVCTGSEKTPQAWNILSTRSQTDAFF